MHTEQENRLTLGLKATQNTNYIEKFFKQKFKELYLLQKT